MGQGNSIGELISELERGYSIEESYPKRIEVKKSGFNYGILLKRFETLGKSFDERFIIDDMNLEVYLNLLKWLYRDETFQSIDITDGKTIVKGDLNKGIYLAGNTGSGKSLAMLILSAMSYEIGRGFRTVITDRLVDIYKQEGHLSIALTESRICFQDLGAEDLDAVYMGNRTNIMKKVIESRGDQYDKLTLFTSNIPINSDRFRAMYEDRVYSRMFSMCNYMVLRGRDWRKHNANK